MIPKPRHSLAAGTMIMILFALFSCGPQNGRPGKTIINGSFPTLHGKQLVLSEIGIRSTTPLDTVTISDNGSFRFKLNRDSAGLYLLKADNRNYLTLVLDMEKKVSVFSDKEIIRTGYRVEGSEDSRRLAEYEAALEANKKIVDSLVLKYNQGQAGASHSLVQRQMDEEYEEVFSRQRDISLEFVKENCGSLASLLVLNRRFGQRKILTEDGDASLYLKVDSCLSARYPGNKHALDHRQRVEKIRQQQALKERRESLLAIGKTAPDITLEDPDGRSISLHSLKGSKVLVYFWASWDKDSRQVNKEISRVHAMFRDQGLKVYAIALESYRDTWIGAIRADKLQWTNVTDYLNIHSGATRLFNVPENLPYFYLLDEDLVIRYKGTNVPELIELLRQDGEPTQS